MPQHQQFQRQKLRLHDVTTRPARWQRRGHHDRRRSQGRRQRYRQRWHRRRPADPAEDAAFDKCFKETGMLMCLCSRVAAGRVVRSPGLQRRGFVAGDNLQPWKARLLLALALTKTTNPDEIQRMLDTY
ncbi:MAG TPA: hypothetical protein VFQ03_07620 [Candidatus Binatia bacterium]|nr:hypothetical protein [Candidatus Binatia bacterium]